MTYVHCTRCGTTLQASAHAPVGGCPRCLAEGEYPLPEMAEGAPPEGMHPELDVVRRAFRLLEHGQHEQMLALFAEDFAGRTLSTGELIEGRLGADAFMARANAGQSTLQADAYVSSRTAADRSGSSAGCASAGRTAWSTRRLPGSIPSRTAASSTPSPSRAWRALSALSVPMKNAKGPPRRALAFPSAESENSPGSSTATPERP